MGVKMSFWQRIQLALQGYTFLHYEKRRGWTNALPIYLVKCKRHDLFFDYPHGRDGYFTCPACLKEEELSFCQSLSG